MKRVTTSWVGGWALAICLTAAATAQAQVVWTKPGTPPAATPAPATTTPTDPAQQLATTQPAAPASGQAGTQSAPSAAPAAAKNPTGYAPVPGKKGKLEYVGPKTVVELAPTPMLDEEGRQRLDPEGKPMFNEPVRQQRDKKGNPLFDQSGKPVLQTPKDMGYDEHGRKIHEKKEKARKTVSVSIQRGTLTVDGMTGKAGLNYEIKDLHYIYVYAPWIGITIISTEPFEGAKEQKNAFDDKTLTVTVEDHTLQVYSDKRLLGKKAESAYVAVDRSFKLPSKFPVMGYGETMRAPYAWPGSRENAELKGAVAAPPLPPSVRPVTLLQPCPAGQMRMPGKTPLPGENAPPQPCVPIQKALPGVGAPKPAPAAAPAAVGAQAAPPPPA